MLRMISSVGPGDVAHEEGAVDVVRRSGKELREDVGAVLVRGDVARVNEAEFALRVGAFLSASWTSNAMACGGMPSRRSMW